MQPKNKGEQTLNKNYLYVGDAAGRTWDHSVCDREFAFNACIPFKTETEYKHIHKIKITKSVSGKISFFTLTTYTVI